MPATKRRNPYAPKLFNRRLARVLTACGLPDRAIAARAGIRPATLSLILHGQNKPRLTTARAIAAALDTTPDMIGLGKKRGAQ